MKVIFNIVIILIHIKNLETMKTFYTEYLVRGSSKNTLFFLLYLTI